MTKALAKGGNIVLEDDIVIDGAEINVGKFKTNAGAVISLTRGATLALKNTEVTVGLDTTYTSYFISYADNATISGGTFNVTNVADATKTYGVEYRLDDAVGAKYKWVEK